MADRFPTADERWPRNGIVTNMTKRIKPKDGNKTFCMAPWTHTYLSPQTERRMCCASREPAQSFKQYIDTGNDSKEYKPLTLKQHWNSDHMRSVRRRMMAGEELKECEAVSYTHLTLPTINWV